MAQVDVRYCRCAAGGHQAAQPAGQGPGQEEDDEGTHSILTHVCTLIIDK